MKRRLLSIGGMATALLASACCLGPALFLAFGITGLGFLSGLEPLRPYMLGLTFVFVAAAWHYAYGKGSGCGPGGSCEPRARRINRLLFWILAGFALFGLAFPYAAAWLVS
ncbi:MAG TPA: mercuric transport protein [Deltaproteobacteria bacterium]|nr:mercuric transport protein [Deltaproteobacteria bacterium]